MSSAANRITVVDIQHKTFKRALQGYDRTDVDQFLDEIIETLEDEATARAALEAEIADMKERISHFKSMEESLQSTLLLAQRTADEVKATAHREADLIRQEAKLQAEREISSIGDRIEETRREHQRLLDAAEQAKSEIRSLLMSHLALIERPTASSFASSFAPTPTPVPAPAPDAAAKPVAAAPPAPSPVAPVPPPATVTHLEVPGVVDESVASMPRLNVR
jgi:cell division initiation protein